MNRVIKLPQAVALVALTIALAMGINYVAAATWVGPTAAPPGNNTDTPVNVGSVAQIKTGDLDVQADLRANTLFIDGGATINGAGPTTAMVTILPAGNVGIGTTAPGLPLEVAGNAMITTDSPDLFLETGATHFNWRVAAQEAVDRGFEVAVGNQDANALDDTYSTLFTIKQSGNVGIGTTAPGATLDIVGNVRNTTGSYFLGLGGAGEGWKLEQGTNSIALKRLTGTSWISVNDSRIAFPTGNVGIGTTAPTEKLDVRGNIKLGTSGNLFAAGGTENLRIIRGTIFDNGYGGIIAGSGFSQSRQSVGHYTISFNPAFSGTPSVTVSNDNNGDIGNCTNQVSAVSASSARIYIYCGYSWPPPASDRLFYFIAIGPK